MKAKLNVVPVKTIKIGMFFIKNNDLYRIQSLNQIKASTINITKGIIDGGEFDINEIQCIKLLADCGTNKFELRYDDYQFIDNLENLSTIEGDLIAFKAPVDVDKQEKVAVNSLAIVDKYPHLFSLPDKRIGELIDYLDGFYLVKFATIELKMKRSEFKLINRYDDKLVFNIKCPYCNK